MLAVGAQYDTMDPTHMEWMAREVRNGRYLHCPNGSHLAIYDDQKTYVEGIISFLSDVDAGTFRLLLLKYLKARSYRTSNTHPSCVAP